MSPRIGLALSGGGSKGAFTVGALKIVQQILEPVPYPVISGTSTGSLVGTLLATNQFARLVDVYSNVQTRNIVNPNHALVAALGGPEAVLFAAAVLGGRAIFDTAALRETIRNNVDFARVKASRSLLVYNTVNLQTGELETFDNRTTSAARLLDALMASASMPVLMEPVPMTRDGTTQQLVDGGVREFLPLRAVFASGVELDHIIAISTAPLRPRRRTASYDKITDILGRTIDLLDSEVGNDDYRGALLFNSLLTMLENAKAEGVPASRILRGVPSEVRRDLEGKRAVPVTVIAPADHLGIDSLEFVPAEMRKVMQLGVDAAKKTVPRIAAELGV
jgi:predicted acylesterase/phospholipase RssA